MRIPTINADRNVAPIQEFMQLIRNVEASKTFAALSHATVAAKTYLQCLKSTHYITQREHYEYQRMLNDVCDRAESGVKP